MAKVTIPTGTESLPMPSPRQLKAIRAFAGINSLDFARKASMSQSTLLDYELSRRAMTEASMASIAVVVRNLGLEFDGHGRLVLEE